MTTKDKVEVWMKEKFPELKELSFGCRFLDEVDGIEYTVVERNDIYDKFGIGKNEVWSVPNFDKGYQADWRFDRLGCGLKIIGHPITLAHYLRAMAQVETITKMTVNHDGTKLMIFSPEVTFDLNTQQPDTEADWLALAQLLEVTGVEK